MRSVQDFSMRGMAVLSPDGPGVVCYAIWEKDEEGKFLKDENKQRKGNVIVALGCDRYAAFGGGRYEESKYGVHEYPIDKVQILWN